MDLLQLLFDFSGRINRAKYWLAIAIYFAVTAVIYIAVIIAAGANLFSSGAATLVIVVAVILYIPLIVSGLAVGTKRLHDRDKSGWWLLVFYVLPGILSGSAETTDLYFIFELASAALSIWGIVELGFLRGTFRANRYGSDPLES